jgi:hypothetical protein
MIAEQTTKRNVLDVMQVGTRYKTSDIIRLTGRPAPLVMRRLSNLKAKGLIRSDVIETAGKTKLLLWKRVTT